MDGLPEAGVKPPFLVAKKETGEDGRPGHGRQLPGAPGEGHLASEEGQGDPVQAEVPIPLHAHQGTLPQEPHQGEGRETHAVHGDAHHSPLAPQAFPEPFHGPEAVGLVDRMDLQVPAPQQHAAQLEVSRMGREQDGAPPFGEG